MEDINNIFVTIVRTKMSKLLKFSPGDMIILYIRCDSNLSHVGKGRQHTNVSERNNTPCIHRILLRHTHKANADTDMVVIPVLEVTEAPLYLPFSCKLSGICTQPATLGDTANL